jgi:NADH:ubiquinone reductase (H+-translocating)
MTEARPRVLVVGSGFAGFHALRGLQRRLPPEAAELVLVSPTDYLLYTPLLPEVASGTIEPRHVAVALRQALSRTRMVLGHVTAVDLAGRTVTVAPTDQAGASPRTEHWDRLVLVPGSVTRQFDIPGVAEHAHGIKTVTEAQFLRDHLLAQLDLADGLPNVPDTYEERRERLTVVAVGAGYTGTETVAQLQRWLHTVASRWNRIHPHDVRWLLIDLASSVLPELGPELGDAALSTLRRRGIDVRLGVTVESATDRSITLTDGSAVPSRTLIWGAGVTANPLVGTLHLEQDHGRLVVDPQLRVPGTEHVWAAGDAAAVPDLTKPTDPDGGKHPPTPPTAQHAQRQGSTLARNVAASLGHGRAREYKHRDLGLVADLGGRDAVAKPLGFNMTGLAAKAVTRAYHLYALPLTANRIRVATDWMLAAVLPVQAVQLSGIRSSDALVRSAQHTDIYPD